MVAVVVGVVVVGRGGSRELTAAQPHATAAALAKIAVQRKPGSFGPRARHKPPPGSLDRGGLALPRYKIGKFV